MAKIRFINSLGCFSIEYFDTELGADVTVSVSPGDWDIVNAKAPKLIKQVKRIWTDDVIQRWKEREKLNELPNR